MGVVSLFCFLLGRGVTGVGIGEVAGGEPCGVAVSCVLLFSGVQEMVRLRVGCVGHVVLMYVM